MYTAKYLSPMIPSFDLAETVSFFQEVLAFQPVMNESTYAVLAKDNLTIHILPAGPETGQMEFYLEVDDVESVWASIKDKIAGLKFRPPFNREYGMREIHLEVPNTNTLLFIGQVI